MLVSGFPLVVGEMIPKVDICGPFLWVDNFLREEFSRHSACQFEKRFLGKDGWRISTFSLKIFYFNPLIFRTISHPHSSLFLGSLKVYPFLFNLFINCISSLLLHSERSVGSGRVCRYNVSCIIPLILLGFCTPTIKVTCCLHF